jgi:adenine phosphoribosyltransferase
MIIIKTDYRLPELNVRSVDVIAAPESRGFIVGAALANMLGIGLIPMRKPGKLPYKTLKCCYNLEYGSAEMHMHEDAILPGQKVILVDDLLATGGTLEACAKLIEQAGGQLLTIGVLIELQALKGREKFGCDVISLMRY